MKRPATLRPCPGGCGTNVPGALISCRKCLQALPDDIKTAVVETPMAEVTAWLDARAAANDALAALAALRTLPWPRDPMED